MSTARPAFPPLSHTRSTDRRGARVIFLIGCTQGRGVGCYLTRPVYPQRRRPQSTQRDTECKALLQPMMPEFSKMYTPLSRSLVSRVSVQVVVCGGARGAAPARASRERHDRARLLELRG
eukprot:scaffold53533_cov28-Phaeocystis_antarctica.AAC.1